MSKILSFIVVTMMLFVLNPTQTLAEETEKPVAVTVKNPEISIDILKLKIRHMNADTLFVEADAWMHLLSKAAEDVYDTKIQIEEQNVDIAAVKEKEDNQTSQKEKNKTKEQVKIEHKEKNALLETLNTQREKRKDIVDKLDVILEDINEKIGLDEKGLESKEVLSYRRYIKAVSGLSVDVTDAKTTMNSIKEWFISEDGGMKWLINTLKFSGIIFVFMLLSRIFSNTVKRALIYSKKSSELLTTFLVGFVRNIVMMIGFLFALSTMDINVAPLLAALGAAGFVVAFALQNTLSNFASGIMIMFYRPFDVDDVVDVAGIIGTVQSMTMVSTSIMTADNRLMIVPNNTIWGNIITNVTHSDKRRVDFTFGIGYNDDIDKAQQVLLSVLAEHPLVLKDPEPTVQVHELADSSVNFICRPWTLTPDYWTVYWEITRRVKIRFDEEGISIPYPQKDIHIITSTDAQAVIQKKKEFSKDKAAEIDPKKMEAENDDA